MQDVMLEWSIVNIPADPEALRTLRAIEGLITAPGDVAHRNQEGVDTEDNDAVESLPTDESEEDDMSETITAEAPQVPEETASDDMQGRLADAMIGANIARAMPINAIETKPPGNAGDDTPPDKPDETEMSELVARAVNAALDARAEAEAKANAETTDAGDHDAPGGGAPRADHRARQAAAPRRTTTPTTRPTPRSCGKPWATGSKTTRTMTSCAGCSWGCRSPSTRKRRRARTPRLTMRAASARRSSGRAGERQRPATGRRAGVRQAECS